MFLKVFTTHPLKFENHLKRGNKFRVKNLLNWEQIIVIKISYVFESFYDPSIEIWKSFKTRQQI